VTPVTPPRRAALEILTRVRSGELLDRAMAAAGQGLEPRDQPWLQELVYGTLRLRGRIDHALAGFVKGGLERLDPDVLDILRLGAYQLLEMGSVPPYAAVSQSVELARVAGARRATGLVNGVLQSLRRAGEIDYPAFEADPVAHLVTWGSHPRWLVERWVARWGPEEARLLVEANNRRPDLFLRPVGMATADAADALRAEGIETEAPSSFPDSLRVLPPAGPVDALRVVPAVVQDPAAAIVVRYAEVPEGATVVDLSAAPGGKTVGLTDRAGFVVAADLSAGRIRRVRANLERTGRSDRAALVVADGRMPPFAPVDAVLVDAPCTGTGTLRRHADGKWRVGEEDLRALAELQRELLAAAARIVRPGGLLIYSTCSLEPEENEEQVERLLERDSSFTPEAPLGQIDGTLMSGTWLSVLPQRHGVDGAFAARLRRAG
jgi:16S rRNA (cytosine967-C5)-methyltransferase